VGRTLSAVTLHEPLTALTDNYLKVQLAGAREPNRVVDVRIGSVAESGIRELTDGASLVTVAATLE